MTDEMRRRLMILLGIADRATDAKQQSALIIGDPEQTMGIGEIAMLLSSCELAFPPAVCGMLVWIALVADAKGVHGTKAWAGLRAALEAIPDIDDPFMWTCELKDVFENAGFDFDRREWGPEPDFSGGERGKYAERMRGGHSYPCEPCQHTGRLAGGSCSWCGGTGRIEVPPPECGCEPDPDMVHDESCPAWCGEPKEGA